MLDFETRAEVAGQVLDISTGGMFVRSDFLEMPGTPVSLLVWLPNMPAPLQLSGRVAWVAEKPPKGPGMGIELSPDWKAQQPATFSSRS
jgi:Tfp pilus assembly protein PilZ